MLVGRLANIANDILNEYSQFDIINKLNNADNVSAQRGQNQDQLQAYRRNAEALRVWAISVIDHTKIKLYPEDIRSFLEKSQYFRVLPENIAQFVLRGFPEQMENSISSGEIKFLTQAVRTAQTELSILNTISQKVNIDEIAIPEGEIGLDIKIPRGFFENDSLGYTKSLQRFLGLIASTSELSLGSKTVPRLTYLSTSDPVMGVAVHLGEVWGVIKIYSELLALAEYHVSLWKTIKDLRSSELDTDGFEEKILALLEEKTEAAIEKVVRSIESKLPEERKNEIKVSLKKDARHIVDGIANGARISVTMESLPKITELTKENEDIADETLTSVIKEHRRVEDRITAIQNSSGDGLKLLLSNNADDK